MNDDSVADSWGATALAIRDALRDYRADGTPTAVATVVHVEGSAYRRPGAKMALVPGGTHLGGITAGCLEGPVADVAESVVAENRSHVETFDLTDDDSWGVGLGCNGVIDVLVEPVDDSWDRPLAVLSGGDPVATLTVTASDGTVPVGARAVVDRDGRATAGEDRPALPDRVVDSLRERTRRAIDRERSAVATRDTDDGELTVFVDGMAPPTELLVFGGQPDVGPVARLAREVGFRVTVATARGARADPERFPDAHEVVATHPTEVGELADERTCAVVMSHNFVDDGLALESLLRTDAPYVGLMGPRKRFEQLREELDVPLTDERRERLATPVGLDLGGGEPVEIALSIVSEALAAANDRTGGRLCDSGGPIHGRPESPSQD